MEKMGIENFKKLYVIILKLVNTGDKMGHKNNWGDRMSVLFGIFPMLMTLSSIKWNQVLPEAKDLDEAERGELVEVTKEELDLEDDKLEEAVEKAIAMTHETVSMVGKIIAFIKDVKALFKK